MRILVLAACFMFSAAPALAQDYRLQSATAADLQTMCRADAGRLWGASLCGPLIVVDGSTRAAWATQRDNQGVLTLTADRGWVGTLPQGVPVANTTVDWGGVRWIMVVGPLPEDPTARRVLLAHEAWHRIQASIGLPMQNVIATHLDTERGRYLMRLELRALSTALMSNGRARRTAGEDALAFRLARFASFAEARGLESSLDRNEGLASYTGVKLGVGDNAALFAARTLSDHDSHQALARAYAYASGPAYGLLLDEYQPDWRSALATWAPADLLVNQLRVEVLSTRALTRRAERYGGPQIAAEERTRAERHRQRLAALRARFAVGHRPLLSLSLTSPQFEFDPNQVTPIEGLGTYYETLTVRDQWGAAMIQQGAVITPNFDQLLLADPDPSRDSLAGPGWVLQPAPGTRIVPQATLIAPPTPIPVP